MSALLAIFAGAGLTLGGAWAWGAVALRRLAAPPELRLALGAVMLSMLIFALLLGGVASPAALAGVCTVPLLLLRWAPQPPLADPAREPLTAAERYTAIAIASIYGVIYFVHALAPETLSDGTTYHLGLTAEYVRGSAFPDRAAFYDLVPQGLEMLYAAAFAVGRHSAAKLVEFGLFLASVPLLFRVARRLGLPDRAALVAAACYFLAPVVATTGSSSFNDAGQVFFFLAAFYLLSDGAARPAHVVIAGVLAGFCYAIKMSGLIVPAAGVAWWLLRRRPKAALLFGLGAAVAIAPWMVRAFALTGNPVAPLFDAWFPNPYFHIATDRTLAAGFHSLYGTPWWRVPWELAMGGRFTGIYGPLLLAMPLAAVPAGRRNRLPRILLALGAVVALPWFSNTSARFIMLAVPLGGLALGAVLARWRTAAWCAIALQAVVCFPAVIDRWEPFSGFRPHGFPLAAALRLTPEPDYLADALDEYKVARMLERNTPAGARILALMTVATAYTDREIAVNWQSAEADRLLDALRVAGFYTGDPFFDVTATWPRQRLRAVRVRLPRSYDAEWCIHELWLLSGADRVPNSRHWTLRAWPNDSEAPLAFDLNLATRWRTWEPMRAGMFLELDLGHPLELTGAAIASHTPVFGVPMEFRGTTPDGRELALSEAPAVTPRPQQDMRLAATHAIRQAGYGYILTPTGREGNGPLGDLLDGNEAEWGLELAGSAGNVRLFRIR